MIWKIEWLDSARKELRKLDQATQKDILFYLRDKIATEEDPRRFGKGLKGTLKGLWRYRIEKYRIVCRILDEVLTVLVVRVAQRSKAY